MPPQHTGAVRDVWERSVRQGEEGHVWWVGSYSNGLPMLYAGIAASARRIAFEIHHGRRPEGPVRAICGLSRCVAPAHMEDTRAHQEVLALTAAVSGQAMPEQCRRGHDMRRWGRWVAHADTPGGVQARCMRCKAGGPRPGRPPGGGARLSEDELAMRVESAAAGGPVDGLPYLARCLVAERLYKEGRGVPVAEIADRLRVTERSVWRYLAEARRLSAVGS